MSEQQTIDTLKDLYNNEYALGKKWQDMTILVINEYEELAKKTGNPISIQIKALKIALGVEE